MAHALSHPKLWSCSRQPARRGNFQGLVDPKGKVAAGFIDSAKKWGSAPRTRPSASSWRKTSIFTLKRSSSDAKLPSIDHLQDGLRRGHPDAGHHLRSRRGVEVRCRAQANVRGSSGVRGVAQTRNAGRGVGRAPAGHSRAHCGSDSCKRLAVVRFTNLGDNREGAPPRFLICYSAQRELFNGV